MYTLQRLYCPNQEYIAGIRYKWLAAHIHIQMLYTEYKSYEHGITFSQLETFLAILYANHNCECYS